MCAVGHLLKCFCLSTASLTPERMMKGPVRLLDEGLNLCDDLGPYLLDQSNFLVVAMMGTQGVGKSALASLFIDPNVDVQKIRFDITFL